MFNVDVLIYNVEYNNVEYMYNNVYSIQYST